MSRFTLPRDLYFGENTLAELKNLKGKKAVIVTGGSSMRRAGFLQLTEDYLREAGMEVLLIEDVAKSYNIPLQLILVTGIWR